MGPGEDTGAVRDEHDVRDRQRGRGSILQLAALGVIASLLGVALGLLIDWFPTPASTQADPIDTLWDVLLIVSVPIFVLVQAVVLYCVWKFKMRPGQELLDGPPIHGNTRLEVIWTIIPAVLILGLCTYAYVVMTDIEEAQASEMRINVVGQQFAWTFEYPQGGDDRPVRTTQLYLPENQPVRFFIRSEDVIHDFWVPAFRMKIDAVPGVTTDYRVTPNRRGNYPVVCAELCGLGHAYMRQTARVVSREEFDRRMRELREGGGTGAASNAPGQAGQGGDQAAAGREVYISNGCGGCHALADAGTNGSTGPNLDDALENVSADEIRRSIVDPNAEITDGFQEGIMPPNYEAQIPPEQLDALVEYLEEASR
jgi:cytochrome c oxidase subunit II